jgi:SAM-dependent methyltransferase
MRGPSLLGYAWRDLSSGLRGRAGWARHLAGFGRDRERFRILLRAAGWSPELELQPQLGDKTAFTEVDHHYSYQGAWVLERLLAERPSRHVDVGSFAGYLGFFAAVCPTTFVDIRPTGLRLPNLRELRASILDLPFSDGELESLSCLHVAEHVGLGRYGDELDPDGTAKAAQELSRVLAAGGNLYVSVPVGRERIVFNAHRIFDPATVLEYFEGLDMVQLGGILDDGAFLAKAEVATLRANSYACGLFWFRKPAKVATAHATTL